jgi:hypothetical protein
VLLQFLLQKYKQYLAKTKQFLYLFKRRLAAMRATTICLILDIMPLISSSSVFPINKYDKVGVKKTAVAVEIEVMTVLSGAMDGSVRNVAWFESWAPLTQDTSIIPASNLRILAN